MAQLGLQTLVGVSNVILVTKQATLSNGLGYQTQTGPIANGFTGSVSPQPAFIFHYEGEQIGTLESDITDHYIEDNSNIHDHIAVKPIEISTHGFMGDLNNVVPPSLEAEQKTVMAILDNISAYNPALTVSALNAYNEAYQAYQIAANFAAQSGLNSYLPSWMQGFEQTTQAQAFSYFLLAWQRRQLFTIQTPWNQLQNMAIKNLRAVQNEETNSFTDFQVTFKQLNFALPITILQTGAGNQLPEAENMAPRAQVQSSLPTDLGTGFLNTSSTQFSSVLTG